MHIEFIPVKTRVVHPPKDEIWDILDGLELAEGDIVFITSKILAIHQGRCVKIGEAPKEELIQREASAWLPYENRGGFHVNLTITDNILIPAAGIDESNADGHYILWPKDADGLCREIRARLCARNGIKNLGVVSTDSHTTPLRWGVTGIATGLAGIEPLRDIRGEPDIFGRKMEVTQVDLVDPLASMAVLLMGEGAEQVPIVVLRGWRGVRFDSDGSTEHFKIPPETDLYQPLLDVMKRLG
ncbi:MAG: coenzyme F420-0:L-glutamate ligase [Rickettsiales bacterium]|jgi:F420-0:gamma-glutamyl ligase|nr:coenzyme F420-0:L-glutamate ligase [Rickettsiales bacterium]